MQVYGVKGGKFALTLGLGYDPPRSWLDSRRLPFDKRGGGRKVRAPQSRMPVNGRPPQGEE